MAGDSRTTEVRTFQTEQEIFDLPGFKEDNLVDKDNYRAILGDYRFADRLRCCLKNKGGGLCNQAHNYGFVVILADESVSIIGNRCGTTHFDAQTKLGADIARFREAQRRQETLERLADLLKDRDAQTARIKAMHADLMELNRRAEEYLSRLGAKCGNQLRLMARGGSGGISVGGVRIREEINEHGERSVERQRFSIPLGSIRGLEIFRVDFYRGVVEGLRLTVMAFDKAAQLDGNASTKELSDVATTLADLPRVLAQGQGFLDAEKEFLASDWRPMVFLTGNRSEQYKIARVALAQAGMPAGKDKAVAWLQSFEAQLKEQYGADQLASLH